MSTQYVSSVGYTAVAAWAATHTYGAGAIVRQLAAPAVGSERCFRTAAGGTSGGSEPVWILTAGGTSPGDGSVTDWVECTGIQARQAANAWNAPHARLANAIASGWGTVGDTLYVSQDHAETQATAYGIVWPGTALLPNYVYCVNRSIGSSVPPVAADLRTTGSVTCSAAGNFDPCKSGHVYFNGMVFIGSNNFTTLRCNAGLGGTGSRAVYENCTLSLAASGSASNGIQVGSAETLEWIHTNAALAALGQSLSLLTGDFYWRGGSLTGIGPTALIGGGGNGGSRARIEGVDLSLITTGKFLVNPTNDVQADINFFNCKLGVGWAVISTTISNIGCPNVTVENCDSGATTNVIDRRRFQGSVTSDTTITRVGGASDGTMQESLKFATLSGTQASFVEPLVGPTMYYWRDDTNPHTVTIDIVNDGATLNNDDVWLEVGYQGDSGSPLTTVISTAKASPISTNAPIPSSTSTWATPGLSTPISQKLTTGTFTPGLKGLFTLRVKMAKQNKTVWIDPLPQVT